MLTGLTGFLPESTLTLYDNLEFLFRILLSAALGAAIGLERTKRQKEAGVRTHCIIACASAVFMILSKYAFIDTAALDGSRGADTARIAAQVVSGISFLGAGVIFKNGSSIRFCHCQRRRSRSTVRQSDLRLPTDWRSIPLHSPFPAF